MDVLCKVLMMVAAYLMGSIPSGYWIVKRKKGIDIRTVESGSMGATNVSRLLGWRTGIAVVAADFLKGFIPTSVGIGLWGINWFVGLVGFFAVLGHIFPALVPPPRFKGGKGVATTVGVLVSLITFLLVLYPYYWLLGAVGGIIVVWVAVLRIFRRMSLASLVLMVSVILFFGALEFLVVNSDLIISVLMIAGLVFAAHRENIQRLKAGKERTM